MHILVTGATGFIGRIVVQLLVERGDQVRVLVRSTSDRSLLEGFPIEYHIGSVTERGSVVQAARDVEAVIHLAAWVSLYSRRIEEMRQVNVTGVENVVTAALEVGVRRVVHVSSIVAVGATPDGSPVNEDFPWPFDYVDVPYVVTKHEGELAALRYARPDMDVVVVNPSLTVGAPDPRGVDPGGIIRFVRKKRLFVTAGGSNFVDVWDAANGIVAALDRGRSGERYILGGENLTFEQEYDLLSEITGIQAPRWRPPYRLLFNVAAACDRWERWTGLTMPLSRQLIWLANWKWFADPSKAVRELGLPHTPVRESLARAVEYYRTHGMV